MKNLKIELHLLQNFPPSCLNRDDTNTPKTCEFGGVTRARVSSQCWKRAVREYFKAEAPERRGIRSKRLKSELINALVQANKGTVESLGKPIEKFVTTFYAGMDKKRPDETNVLVFWSAAEFAKIVEILSRPDILEELSKEAPAIKKNEIEKELKQTQRTSDVALFARMLADSPGLNIDAACQVAHAISTHAVNLELDFFTAVDDLKDKSAMDDAGAGMLGTVGYDSACYYRYALVDFEQLSANLNGGTEDALNSLEAFLKAFIDAIPGAKRNSFAHGNQPFLVLAVVRGEGTPCSLVNAFARPVNPRDNDLLAASATALAKHAARLDQSYETYSGVSAFHFQTIDAKLDGLPGEDVVKMRELITKTVAATREFAEAKA
jgi:CRISPR system Cascade subunit CasC